MRRLLSAFILVLLSADVVRAQSVAADTVVKAAITAAVRARLGAAISVRIADLETHGDLGRPFVAQPAPGVRTGMRGRFLLLAVGSEGQRVGEADATVFVSATHLRTARDLRRGSALGNGATEQTTGDVGSIPLQPLPDPQTLGGAVAAREILAGEVLTASMVAVPAIVRPGDKMVVRSAAGAVYVQAVVVATQPGRAGEVIRCVNPDTRRSVAARVVGPGLGEVVHAY